MSGVNFPSNNTFINNSIKDNKIDKNEYKQLLNASSPTKNEQCLEDEKNEMNFINGLNCNSSAKTEVKNQGSADACIDLFDDVPETLENTWKEASKDSKIDAKEYQTLLNTAAPNHKDEELDKEEISFLKKVKSKLTENNGEHSLKPTKNEDTSKSETKSPSTKSEIKEKVPSTLKDVWKEVSKDNKIDKNEYQTLLKAAAPNSKNSEFSEEEVSFLKDLRNELSENNGSISLDNKK